MIRWWTNYGDLIRSLNHEFAELRLRLHHMENETRQNRKQIMSAIDDLKQVVTELGAAVDAEVTELQTALDKIAAIVGGNVDPALVEVTAALTAMKDRLSASKTAADNVLAPVAA